MTSMASLFANAEHEAFQFPAERDGSRGALLLHGFMGTPRELRPLGAALAEAGIAAYAPRLPGFGGDIDSLPHRSYTEWIDAARAAWADVQARHDLAFLIGFSMGGSVAIHIAAESPPAALILLAPFQRIPDKRALLIPVGKYLMPEFKPFEHADFDDPMVRDGFHSIDPAFDLDDPATQDRLRNDYLIPTAALRELQKIGKSATGLAKEIDVETLVVQGLRDDTVLPDDTRELVKRISGPVRLLELDVDHQLVRENRPAWPAARDAIVTFASELGGR